MQRMNQAFGGGIITGNGRTTAAVVQERNGEDMTEGYGNDMMKS